MTGPRRAAGASGRQQSSVNDHNNLELSSLWNTPKKKILHQHQKHVTNHSCFLPTRFIHSQVMKRFFFLNFIWKKYVSSFNSQQQHSASCEHMSSPMSPTKRNLKSEKKCQWCHKSPSQSAGACVPREATSAASRDPQLFGGWPAFRVWRGASEQLWCLSRCQVPGYKIIYQELIPCWLPTSHGYSTKG